jgi:hypothetical protein
MRQESKAPIFDRSAKDYVEATLIDGVTWEEIVDAQSVWRPAMKDLTEKLDLAKVPQDRWPEHKHWDWRLKFLMGEVEGLRLFGLHHELLMQGLMMVKPQAKSKLDTSKKVVYIDYLASAPWNLSVKGAQVGRFGQIGRVFVAAAVQLSQESGFSGRIGLYALPQAVSWYEGLAMIEVPSAATSGLRYFEMTQETASIFLEEK